MDDKEKQTQENIKDIEDIFDTDWKSKVNPSNNVNPSNIVMTHMGDLNNIDPFDVIVMTTYEDYKKETPAESVEQEEKQNEKPKQEVIKQEKQKPKPKKEVVIKNWDDEEEYYDEYDDYGTEYDYYMMK